MSTTDPPAGGQTPERTTTVPSTDSPFSPPGGVPLPRSPSVESAPPAAPTPKPSEDFISLDVSDADFAQKVRRATSEPPDPEAVKSKKPKKNNKKGKKKAPTAVSEGVDAGNVRSAKAALSAHSSAAATPAARSPKEEGEVETEDNTPAHAEEDDDADEDMDTLIKRAADERAKKPLSEASLKASIAPLVAQADAAKSQNTETKEARKARRRAEQRALRKAKRAANKASKPAIDAHPAGGRFSTLEDGELADPSSADDSDPYSPPPAAATPPDYAAYHQRYHGTYPLPTFHAIESRPLFSAPTHDPRDEVLRNLSPPPPPTPPAPICQVCRAPGHLRDTCPELTCTHCGASADHFSHACPTLPEPAAFDWRALPPDRLPADPPRRDIPTFCYYCAANTHFGDDCPRLPEPERWGSYSIAEARRRGYVDDAEAERMVQRRNVRAWGRAAEWGEVAPFDPFEEYKKTPEVRRGGGGGGYNGGGAQGGRRRQDLFTQTTGGGGGRRAPPPPPRRQEGYGGGGGGGGRNAKGGNSYRPSGYASKQAWNQYKR